MARVGQQVVGLDEDRLPGRVAVGVLTRVFPPALVDEVVAGAGVVEQRIRVLPARLVVYYTLAMILFFQSSYSQVWVKLVGGLDWARSFRARVAVGMSPSPAAISKARARLGWQVMADLLERVAGPLAGQDDGWAYVAGLRLVAVDGLTVDVPDTAANATQFGRPGGGAGPGAFPQVRVVALAECGSRALMGARCAGITTGEQGLTTELTGLFGAGMLVVADRNFLSHQVLRDTLTTGAHALLRAKSDTDLPVLGVLDDGTYLSRIADPSVSGRLRRQGKRGADMIRQELYALLCVYQAIRTLICHSADRAGLDPDRISFTRAKNAIAARVSDAAAFSPRRPRRRPRRRDHLPPPPRASTPAPVLHPLPETARRALRHQETRRPSSPSPPNQVIFWVLHPPV